MILLGALLLVTPGFLSDLFGLVLLIPATRRPLEVALIGYLKGKVARGQLRVQGMGGGPGRRPSKAPTEVGRAAYRPGEVIDTQGEEVDD